MIHSLKIVNPKNEALELELAHPEKSGLIVTKVEGLGPPQATINGQEIATSDGMIYSSARAGTRNVVLYLKMFERDANSPYGPLSIEESRHLTYQYFPLKKEITIYIRTDVRTFYCKGYVESNLPDIFSDQEGCQVSVICTDPWLYTEGDQRTVFSGIHGVFEFPFSNESLTENLIEFGQIWLDTRAILNYQGTVDTGIIISIHAFDTAEKIRIYNVDTREQMVIDTEKVRTITGKEYGQKDDIVISTIKGQRYCRLLRDGAYTNIIGALSKDTDWFQISAGNNGFAFSAEKGADNLSVTFSYQNAYVGV